ncbi:penicillin acylase family protein [Candidatus Poriferisodalis sp.]|uniref:penicillin acylase family protein n=1 Tax=Candidatus Poriferisodalis sp. TaxID=3101277 RepID=UPI003B0200C2
MSHSSDRGGEAVDALGATVRRDRWGIAHAEAPSAAAAFAAQGWVAADDRIWQMEWDRRRALGRWAEIVGMAGAREDAFLRRLGLVGIAQADYAALQPGTQAMCEAYTQGVNRWLADFGGALPAEFDHHPAPPEPWEPWHCVAVYKLRHIFMGTLTRKLWRGRIMAQAGAEAVRATVGDVEADAAIVPGDGQHRDVPGVGSRPDLLADAASVLDARAADMAALAAAMDSDGASNSWALSGDRTASGKPLLAGDPHRGIEFPNVYHQCHLICDEFDAIGMGFPGVPGFPHFGHNAEVAWGITHGMCDDTDVFVERFDGSDGSWRLADGTAVDWRAETLEIRGEGTVEVLCGSTPRGPVVLGDPADGVALSMQWTAMFGADTTLDALWPMLVAASAADLVEAVRPWVLPVNNLLAADRTGAITFKIRGRVVERSTASRWTPVPGTGEFAWDGLEPVPFEDLPEWTDPERGFLVTANNRTADGGPFISLDFAGPSRHDRICELLAPMSGATVDEMARVHADVTSLVAPKVLGLIIEHAVECGHEMSHGLLDLLAEWDQRMAADSPAAAIYAVIKRRLIEAIAERLGIAGAELGAAGWPPAAEASRMAAGAATRMLCERNLDVVPGLDNRIGLRMAISACVDETAAELSQRLGDDPAKWTWGRVHRMASPHPLASALSAARDLHPPADGCAGDGDTVRQGGTAPETGERAIHGSVARYAFDLGDWDRSGWVVPHGVSGVRGSGHDLDQRQAWLDCELVPMAYSTDAVASVTTHVHEI